MRARLTRRSCAWDTPMRGEAGMLKPVIAVTFVGCLVAQGQLGAQAKPPAAKSWTPPRPAAGHTDLQVYCTNPTWPPLERPPQLAGKATMTAEEAAAYVKQI